MPASTEPRVLRCWPVRRRIRGVYGIRLCVWSKSYFILLDGMGISEL